jgi:NAD(P)H-flavin reductase
LKLRLILKFIVICTLSLCSSTGRPNYGEFFAQLTVETRAQPGSRVAVLACGPEGMMDLTREAAAEQHFDYHAETFLF